MVSSQKLSPLLAMTAALAIVDARSIPTSNSSTFTSIKWSASSCPTPAAGFDCGWIEVPVDWDNPHAEKVQLGMLRHNATKSEERVGSLIFNPGGPGDNATVYIQQATALFGKDVSDKFDIIGLDPRGVGLSSPIKCDPEIYNRRAPFWPSNQEELDTMVDKWQALGESCLKKTGPLVKHLDSVSVAKDLEAIRQGLGEEKLNYLGLSYGTLIGQTYAELYPQNIRTMTLDGVMDHGTDPISYQTVKSTTYETELIRFADWCSKNSTCALNGTSAEILKVWDDLVEQGNKEPLPAPTCKKTKACAENVTGKELINNAGIFLTFVTSKIGGGTWVELGKLLLAAKNGDASGLSNSFATSEDDSVFVNNAITCSDWFHPTADIVDLKNKEDLTKTMWPHVQSGEVTINNCIGWPFPQVNPLHRANIVGTSNILLVSSQYDPSCSYIWANGLKEQISNSTLLTRRGDGHTSYAVFGETWAVINNYIVNQTLPADNTWIDS